MDAFSRAPIPVKPGQWRIVLEEFPERVVLLVRSWDERVIALPGLVGQEKKECPPLVTTTCKAVSRFADKAHAQY